MKRGRNEETIMKQQGEDHRQEEESQEVLIEGEVLHVRERKGLMARVRTEDYTIEVRIFHPTALHRRNLVRGANVKLIGRLIRMHGRRCLIHPRIILKEYS